MSYKIKPTWQKNKQNKNKNKNKNKTKQNKKTKTKQNKTPKQKEKQKLEFYVKVWVYDYTFYSKANREALGKTLMKKIGTQRNKHKPWRLEHSTFSSVGPLLVACNSIPYWLTHQQYPLLSLHCCGAKFPLVVHLGENVPTFPVFPYVFIASACIIWHSVCLPVKMESNYWHLSNSIYRQIKL